MEHTRGIRTWVGTICAMIVAMVAIGGITRLTNSGLSIVDWNPIMGAIPPMDVAAWQDAFGKYQQYPQFKILNPGMSLGEFKFIFFWEYFHRLIGRLMGVVFLIPWLWFSFARQSLDRRLSVKLFTGFVLGGMQGLLGWFMVKSGLVDLPRVSHYRLAAHLGLALIVFCWMLWIWMDLKSEKSDEKFEMEFESPEAARPLRRPLRWITFGVALQILYGAFVAGLRAGFGYNTFPKMNDEWIPTGLGHLSPGWLNWLENPTAVQFIHRCLAWGLLALVSGFWIYSRKQKISSRQRQAMGLLMVAVWLQFALGVATLLAVIPVGLAILHQMGAVFLVAALLGANHSLKSA